MALKRPAFRLAFCNRSIPDGKVRLSEISARARVRRFWSRRLSRSLLPLGTPGWELARGASPNATKRRSLWIRVEVSGQTFAGFHPDRGPPCCAGMARFHSAFYPDNSNAQVQHLKTKPKLLWRGRGGRDDLGSLLLLPVVARGRNTQLKIL